MFFKNLCYHIRTAGVLGFHGELFFSGHGGSHNEDFSRMIDLVQPRVSTRLTAVTNDEDLHGVDGELRGRVDHAGKAETSTPWAAEPACVDLSRLPDSGTPGTAFRNGPQRPRG